MSEARTILVVDDDPGIREYLRNLLSLSGYCVEAVSGGEEALGRPWLELCVPEDSRPIVAPILERAFRSRAAPPHFEHAIVLEARECPGQRLRHGAERHRQVRLLHAELDDEAFG